MKLPFSFGSILLGGLALATFGGCSICCGPDDYNYGTYGGIHPRADMRNGRVGSIFSDPSGTAMNLTPYREPDSADEPERIETPQQNEDPNLPNPNANDGAYYEPITEQEMVRSQPKRMETPPARRRASRTRQAKSFLGGRRMR